MAPVNVKRAVSAFSVYSKKNVVKKKKKLDVLKKDNKRLEVPNQDTLEDISIITKRQSSANTDSLKSKRKKKKKISNRTIELEERDGDENNEEDTAVSDQYLEKTNGHEESENMGSIEEGKIMFEWLVHPLRFDEFMKDPWEKRPYHGQRNNPSYYSAVLSTEMIDKMLRKHNVKFTKNIDVTTYSDGVRETLNPPGRATAERVWAYYENGCSVRLLNPQSFIPQVGMMVATLQELFGCMVGANVYLTPPDSQGFAPHYDDIEAFVMQIEGKKHWRVYSPRSEKEVLPRFSSQNLTQEELGEPLLDVVLTAGDILYFPRGFIHQANTVPGEHSLHITLSSYQRHSWADILEKMLPAALSVATEETVDFRRGLPVDYLQYMGVAHSDKTGDERREAFITQLHQLFDKLWEHLPIDAAVDQMAKEFMHDAFPPVLTEEEVKQTVTGGGLRMLSDGKISKDTKLQLTTKIKLLRAHILRLVMEDDNDEDNDDEDTVDIFHYADNSMEYHGEDPQSFKISADLAPGVEFLISCYPQFVSISDIPLDTDSEKINLASDLWQRGLLLKCD
ncbi:ribosomal oxygenase 1 isoform X1 [Schistocerca cancellata]|uniref:ribosomal oxygenase 1 isoform X1 n=1 Tax=Schistocerca cancellata TaxID=274614 RepID=UPI002117A126|nr:ribosomal oxygenase 1 isoform X1 [Schistocerca cancellata]